MILLYGIGSRSLIKDIKANGYVYFKSELVAKELKKIDKRLNITYNKEDRTYTATYNK